MGSAESISIKVAGLQSMGCDLIENNVFDKNKYIRERILSMYEGGWGFSKFFKKKFRSLGEYRPKYFTAQ